MTNKEIVAKFYEEVFNAWDTSKLDEYMLPTYKQHNPTVEDGRDGFARFCERFFAAVRKGRDLEIEEAAAALQKLLLAQFARLAER